MIKAAKRYLLSIDENLREVIRGSSVAFVLRVIGAGFSFAVNIIVARYLGAEGAGVYFLALTVTGIASVVGRFGLDKTLMRYVASFRSKGDWKGINAIHRKGLLLMTGASVAIALAVYVGAEALAIFVFQDPTLTVPLQYMACAIPLLNAIVIYTHLLKGLKKIPYAMLLQGFGVPLLSIPLFIALAEPYGVSGVAAAYVAAAFVTAAFGYFLWRCSVPRSSSEEERVTTRGILKSSMPLLWVASMHLVMKWTDTVMLGIWETSSVVGVYEVAYKTAILTTFVLIAVNSIAAPKFSELYSQGQMQELEKTARGATVLLIIASLPIVIPLIVVPSWILAIFGGEFTDGSVFLVILAVGQFINVATGSVGYLLMMTGRETILRNVVTVAGIANITLNLILIPYYGGVGAAIATASSIIVQNVLAAVFVYRELSISLIPAVKA